MIYRILELDYAVAIWFSKTKDRVVPGAVFLFLNKLAFCSISAILVLYRIALSDLDVKVLVGIVVLVTSLIMYGLQKPLERHIKKNTPRRIMCWLNG